jgi:phage terminase large subunit
VRSPKQTGRNSHTETVARMLGDPVNYARVRLGLKLHPVQAAVLRDLFRRGSRVSFRCGNEVGKSSVVAVSAVFYAIEILSAQVVSTAGAWRQVTEQLVPNLKRQAHKFPGWEFLDSAISVKGVRRYLGFSTTDEGKFQGFHGTADMPLLVIIDEAAVVPVDIFGAAEERCNPDYFLAMGSPLDPAGTFYDMETKLAKFYVHHKLPQTECTRDKGWWINPVLIQRKIEKYGREHPLVLSNVFGEFASMAEGALASLGEFESCIANPPQWHRGHNDRHAFIDFAAGRNKNVFAVRVGNKTWIEKKWTETNTMAAVGECLAIFKKLQREHGLQADEVEGDADGLGLPMIQRLHEVGLNLGAFHGGTPARFNPTEYANAISEAWGESVGQIKRRDHLIPNDAEFKGQVLSRKLKRNSTGKFQLESKEDMARRGLESPDEADAILCAMMSVVSTRSVNLSVSRNDEPDERGWIERAYDGGGDYILPAESCL